MKKLSDLNLSGKRVLIRADLQLPVNEQGELKDDSLLKRIVPGLQSVIGQGGRPILLGHVSKGSGKNESSLSLQPLKERLEKITAQPVFFAADPLSAEIRRQAAELPAGTIVLMENLRRHPGEQANDPTFAAALAAWGDVYVNEAPAASHCAHASVVRLPALLKERAAGPALDQELKLLQQTLDNPRRPFCLVLGGSKLSVKLKALTRVAAQADKVIIGGALAHTFLAAQGFQMGRSLYEPPLIARALEIMGQMARRDCKLYLPVDFRTGDSPGTKGRARIATAQELPAESMALDIGPATSLLYAAAISTAETIIWNGPMGAHSNEEFAAGTHDIVQALAAAHGTVIAGGAGSVGAIHHMELLHKFDYVSYGDAAFVELLAGELPVGIKALG